MANTADQQRAIDTRGRHLLLSAAAGSGKTYTMVERILALLSEGAQIDSMLIITFTRSAAADMKAKLIKALSVRAQDNPVLLGQLRHVETANIQTIDAFCGEVVRTHFEAAGADPLFRVADEPKLRQMMSQALDKVCEDAYAQGGAEIEALHFGRGIQGVREAITSLYFFSQNRPDPEDWLRHSLIELPTGDGQIWVDELIFAARRALRAQLGATAHAMHLCELPNGPAAYAEAIEADGLQLAYILNEGDQGAFISALMGFVATKAKAIRKADMVDEAQKARVTKIRSAYKKVIAEQQARFAGLPAMLDDMAANQPANVALCEMVCAFMAQLSEIHAEKGLVSFSDVAHGALRALRQQEVADALRARFSHIFVDEYQDVTDMQQALVDCIAREDNLFMVGDVKQSIYRFRHAEPSLFVNAYTRFSRGEGGELIPLSQNFRSRSGMLAFVNAVFERAMEMEGSELSYDEVAWLHPGAQFEGEDPPVELYLCARETLEDEEKFEDEPFSALEDAEREGLLIAERILRIRAQEQLYDPKRRAYRPYTFRDFAIMIRNRNGMRALERVLVEAGVPVYADINAGYLDAVEVKVALSLLQLIENRRRDLPLLAVLHSPIGNLRSDELALIRLQHQGGSYRDAMMHYLAHFDDAIAHKLQRVEQHLERWRGLCAALPVPILLDTAMLESGYYAHIGKGKGGAARQANLDLLMTYATDYESQNNAGLTGFLQYIEQIERRGDDMATAHTLGEGDDVVQIMTIHKSKGLEYPVVIGAQLGKSMSHREKISDIGLHRQLGCGISRNDIALGSRRKTLAQRAIAERVALEQLNEELRVIYVLLTRAVDRLILVGSLKDIDAAAERWRISAQNPGQIPPKMALDLLVPLLLDIPGGEALFEKGECALAFDGTKVSAHVVPMDYRHEFEEIEADEGVQAPPTDAQMRRAIASLDWQYPHEDAVLRPLKLTVSGLVRELTGPTALPAISRRPKFLSEDGLSNTERGTLTHQALMALDLVALRGLSGEALRKQLQAQLGELLAQGRLVAALEPTMLVRFFESSVGRRMLNADEIHREWPFNIRMPMRDALGEDSEESILVQGVIDCCFVEDGEWILLDYKTDRSSEVKVLAQRYAPQLALYATALSRITRMAVRQSLLCLLRSGVAVDLTADDEYVF